jgi:hypothetical protein
MLSIVTEGLNRRRILAPFPNIPEGGIDIAMVNIGGPRGSPCRIPVRENTVPNKSEASLESK